MNRDLINAPWLLDKTLFGEPVVVTSTNKFVCRPHDESYARLIAAAPEMLEALMPFAQVADDENKEDGRKIMSGDLYRAREAVRKTIGDDNESR